MRTLATAIALSASIALTGCATTSEVQQAQDAYIAATIAIIAAYDAGEISQEQYDEVYLPLLDRGDRILDRVEAGDPFSDAIRAELNNIALELARARGSK